MRIAFYLNVISPHQLPLGRAVAKRIGESHFSYVYAEDFLSNRKAMGWNEKDVPSWCFKGDESSRELVDADLVYTGIRCPTLMAKRVALGKKTVYYSERWFKPIPFAGVLLPGYLRMFSQNYRKMAMRIVRLINTKAVKCLPCGPFAAEDFRRMGVSSDQMVPWGYFVSPGKYPGGRFMSGNKLHILWVGRISRLKRVDTIIKALGCQRGDVEVTIVGDGPAKNEIMRLAVGYPVTFLPSQPIELIREIMRRHDVYVFPSNGMEGWGAVVNEALEEGMYVIGTRETGACATLLAEDALFSCGDWRRLGKLLIQCGDAKRQGVLKGQGIGLWTAESAAERLMGIA